MSDASATPGIDHGTDPAVARARRVIGLYGDPDVSWSILLALELDAPLSGDVLAARLDTALADHPHLGRRPVLERFDRLDEQDVLSRFADQGYGGQDALVRVALAIDGRSLVLAAHHGVIDGLGLVGLAGVLLDTPLGSNARGVARTGAEPGFVRGSVGRLVEALFRPPVRFRGRRRGASGDWLVAQVLPLRRVGTAALVATAHDLLRRWNGPERERGRQPVIAIGISRRPGTPPLEPHRDTAYARVRTRTARSRADVLALVAATEPEPDFPENDGGGIGPLVTRRLAGRLGASVLVSNLGLLEGGGVRTARFWPTATGPNGVGIGLVSVAGATGLTVRARRGWFSREDAVRLLELAVRELDQTDRSDQPGQ